MHWLRTWGPDDDEPQPQGPATADGANLPVAEAADDAAGAPAAPDADPAAAPGRTAGWGFERPHEGMQEHIPSGRPRRRSRMGTAGTALAGAVIGGLLVAGALAAYHVNAAGTAQIVPVPTSAADMAQGSPGVAVVKKLSPSIVLVTNESTVNTFYGSQDATAYGSGVIFSTDGYIVTNDHVVAGATKVSVTLADGSSYPATVVGGDASTDLAVIRINAGHTLPAATFADSDAVQQGQMVFAVGNPLGPQYPQSVTQGIVGAVRPMLYGLDPSTERVTQMIQTDASINPGNSGGALADMNGDVIGITSMKVAQTGDQGVSAAGLGFAIPSNTVQMVVNQLVRNGHVTRAWLGIAISESPPEQDLNNADEPQTLTVSAITGGGPSDGQLQTGDVINAWNGQAIPNYLTLVGFINAAKPGDVVRIGVVRAGKAVTVPVTLGTEPANVDATTQSQQPQQQQPQQQSPYGVSPFGNLFPPGLMP